MCGIFGIYAPNREVARITHFGLLALQHRGQESAGIAVSDDDQLLALRDMGLVAQVFTEEKLHGLHGQAAIGHTRYSTTGGAMWTNAQPSLQHGALRSVAVAHNGNLTNASELRDQLEATGVRLRSSSDTEVIAALVARDERPLEEAVAATMAKLEGAYAITMLTEGKLIGFRDPDGIRPLALGRLDGHWVLASESCVFDLLGGELVREVLPGELIVVDDQGLRTVQAVEPANAGHLCIFEFIYFARPDTRLGGVELHRARVRMGERLAAEAPADADVVIPVPDSGTPAAIGFARASGIPYDEGLIKNRYVGRTFIQPDQALREHGIRTKFNPLGEVRGKRVVIVDDSIVRGTTTRKLVRMLFEAGATEVHVRVSSPPIVSPCFYGIDIPTEEELVASSRTVEEVRELLGATSLAYLSLEGLQEATGRPAGMFCRGCLTGEYPTRVPFAGRLGKLRFEPARLGESRAAQEPRPRGAGLRSAVEPGGLDTSRA